MKIDFFDIGLGAILACWGATLVIDSQSDAARRSDCDKRGGVLAKVDDSWRAEKYCAVAPKK